MKTELPGGHTAHPLTPIRGTTIPPGERQPVPNVPGYEGSQGPFRGQYGAPHVYARDVHSGAGNCVCGWDLGEDRHTEAAPGIAVPDRHRHPGSRWLE